MPRPYATGVFGSMSRPPLLTALAALALAAASAVAQPMSYAPQADQRHATEKTRGGDFRPLPVIQRDTDRAMAPARRISSEFHEDQAMYRLKYMADRKVIWVDVDARSGRVIRKQGE